MNIYRAVGLVFCVSAQDVTFCAATDGGPILAEPQCTESRAAHLPSLALLQHGLRLHGTKDNDLQRFVSNAMADELTDGSFVSPKAEAASSKRRGVYTALTDVADRLAADAVMVHLFARKSKGLILWAPMIFLTLFTWAMLYLWGSRFLGRVAASTIERIDQGLLGVDIDIEDTDVQLWFGRIDLLNVTVNNPPGFSSEYLLKAHRITIDLDVLALVCSLGKKIVIEELTLDTIDAIIEYDGYVYGTSNVQKVLDFLEKNAEKPDDEAAPAAAAPAAPDSVGVPADAPGQAPEKQGAEEYAIHSGTTEAPTATEAPHGPEVQLRKVAVLDIGLKAATKLGAVSGMWMHSEGGVAGVRASVADIEFENFTEEFGAKSTGQIVKYVLTIVCKSAVKTSVANLAGKDAADRRL